MSGSKRSLGLYGALALVTGASDGIGRAFAFELARRGYGLILIARRHNVLAELARDLQAAYGIPVDFMAVDLASTDAVERVIAETAGRDIGLLVAAAGFGTSGPFTDCVADRELEMIDVNCRAVTALAHAFAGRFVARRRGGIVLMSSLVAFQGVPLAATYAATKAFVQSLAEALHHELRPYGIDVAACAPGPVASGFAARADMRMSRSDQPEAVAIETLDRLGRRATVRAGRLGRLLEAALTGMPRWGRVLIMARVMRGMAAGGRASSRPTSGAGGGPA